MKKLLIAAIIFAGIASGCGEPLSDTEREIRKLQKQNERMRKRLERQGIEIPTPEQRSLKELSKALTAGDMKLAHSHYLRLSKLGAISSDLKTSTQAKVSEKLSGYPMKDEVNRLIALRFLADIDEENSDYADQRDSLEEALITNFEKKLGKLKKNYDKVEGNTWYYHSHQKLGPSADLYLGQDDKGHMWLRLRGEFSSQYGWLFVDRILAWYDGQKVQLLAGKFERKSASIVREWKDVSPTNSQVSTMMALANAKEAILRFEGNKGTRDFTLTSKDKQAILDILEVYEAYEELKSLGILTK